MNKAIFFDRDGVLNALVDSHSPRFVGDIIIMPFARKLLKTSRKKGYLNFIVTNQPDYAKGNVGYIGSINYINDKIIDKLGKMIDDYRICYHHPESRFIDLRECNCRKPKPGMILSLKEEYDIDLDASILIGDREVDIEAGINAGVGLNIKVDPNKRESKADLIVENLGEFCEILEMV
jgi:D-glycero-D-manno-heptose 1,7-bisphosphate phosphatase